MISTDPDGEQVLVRSLQVHKLYIRKHVRYPLKQDGSWQFRLSIGIVIAIVFTITIRVVIIITISSGIILAVGIIGESRDPFVV